MPPWRSRARPGAGRAAPRASRGRCRRALPDRAPRGPRGRGGPSCCARSRQSRGSQGSGGRPRGPRTPRSGTRSCRPRGRRRWPRRRARTPGRDGEPRAGPRSRASTARTQGRTSRSGPRTRSRPPRRQRPARGGARPARGTWRDPTGSAPGSPCSRARRCCGCARRSRGRPRRRGRCGGWTHSRGRPELRAERLEHVAVCRLERPRPLPGRHTDDDLGRARAHHHARLGNGPRMRWVGRIDVDLAHDLEARRVATLRLERTHDEVPLLREVGDIARLGSGEQPSGRPLRRQPDPARLLAAQEDRRAAGRQRRGRVDSPGQRVERVRARDAGSRGGLRREQQPAAPPPRR